MHRKRQAIAAVAAGLLLAAPAAATAPPVGTLPVGPVRDVVVAPGGTFDVVLPTSPQRARVWRLARPYRSAVVRQTAEGERGRTTWVRFKGVAAGRTSIVFALTRGERSYAFAARTFRVTVR
jgi:hypothetical protein